MNNMLRECHEIKTPEQRTAAAGLLESNLEESEKKDK